MHHVFVSYSREDAAWVHPLVRRIELAGHETWLDQRDIPMSLPWFDQVRDAIIEAAVFVICDSRAARDSVWCRAEEKVALEAGKQAVEVEVGASLESASGQVLNALGRIDADYELRTELAVRARNWERDGRQRGALVTSRTRRRLARTEHTDPPFSVAERAFLRASRSRARRRGAASALAAVLLVAGTVTTLALNAVNDRIKKLNDEQATAYTRTRAAVEANDHDPMRGLQEASLSGETESANSAKVIEQALSQVTPDDGFHVPAGASRFAAPVAGTVAVTDGAGRWWRRSAAATNERAATRGHAPSSPSVQRASAAVSAQTNANDATVRVVRQGHLWRRIVFPDQVAIIRISPNGRELAAGMTDGSVAIADLDLGAVRTRLYGSGFALRDLAWSHDGRRLWGLTRGLVVGWSVRTGRVVADDPHKRFEAVLAAAESTDAWTVARDGELARVDLVSGHVAERVSVPDRILSAGGSADGSVAAVSGDRGEWIVPLTGGAPRLVQVPGCNVGRATFRGADTIFLPCISGQILEISASRAKVVGEVSIGKTSAFAARVMPRSGTLLASDTFGYVYAYPASGNKRLLWFSKCGASTTRIAVAANDSVVAPVGAGTGAGCSRRGQFLGGDPASARSWTFDAVRDSAPSSSVAGAAAATADGRAFAYGYSDGTIVVHPTANVLPAYSITNVVGEVRDMFFTAPGTLVVATAAGTVQAIPICESCLSNRAMSRIARTRLRRSAVLGVAKRMPVPSGSAPRGP